MENLPKLQAEDLACNGVLPSGPVCPWPKPEGLEVKTKRSIYTVDEYQKMSVERDTVIKASAADMAKGLFRNVGLAVTQGKVSKEVRDERYNICKQCPHFIEQSKRCSECGCFMEAKTWINAKPSILCPKDKWPR